MWNKHVTRNDEFLGEVRLPLASLKMGGVDVWYDLQKRKKEDEVQGQLHLLVSTVRDNNKFLKRKVAKRNYFQPGLKKEEVEEMNNILRELEEQERNRQRRYVRQGFAIEGRNIISVLQY